MEEVKNEELHLKHDKQGLLREFKRLKSSNGMSSSDLEKHRKNERLLNSLHERGVIDDQGNPVDFEMEWSYSMNPGYNIMVWESIEIEDFVIDGRQMLTSGWAMFSLYTYYW